MAKEKIEKTKAEPLEKQLWKAADKLRKNIDAAEYKHIVLGLIFLKYISDSFEQQFTKLSEGKGEYAGADPEDKDEYAAENVFFVPQDARWSYLQSQAKQPDIGKLVDAAMDAIEKENPSLKGVLPKVFARDNLDPASLGQLIDLVGNIALGDAKSRSADVLGHVFEYFLGEFALAEGKQGGQFYTPRSVVELLVEMLEPYQGRVFDPCCGSGGMFVQSEKFVADHQGRVNDISIYGQESNQTTWRLAKMNLAIRGIEASQVKWNNEGSFLNDAHKDVKADYIIANTPAVFGNYVDIYDIAQAVEDGATVRIYYESRLAKVQLSDEGKKLVAELDEELEQDELTETQKAKSRWTQIEALIGSEKRIQNIAQDIVTHFTQRQEVFAGKGMIVSMSRRIAAALYAEIIKIKPEWHSDDLSKGVIKVVMTASSSDGPQLAKHHTTKQQRRNLAERMKDPDDELKLVIVRDMWLTGFDAPSMHTLYIDKPMKGHNLMQAIARVNRVYKDKPGGLVVDYLGIAADLKQALSFYSDAGGKGDPAETQEQAVNLMLEKLEVVANMYHGFGFKEYFTADTSKKLSLILAAEEHILNIEDGKKRYINEVTLLSQAFAIAIPHEQAMDVKDEVAFFQAVKARLAKFDSTSEGKTNEEIETTIRQVIDKALVSEQVIDVFDAAGIKKPDISILSDEFLMELKNHEHKNIALEVLKKLLNEEIKVRERLNVVQGRSLMEMLQNSIKRYQNKIITAAELMDELIKVSKEIVHGDSEAERLKLSPLEFAFYTAVANNDSARELMQQDKLRELAVVLLQKVRENASIDWTIKESVKAKLKVIVKRTLRQFGYPPDMEILATETVLKQAEMIAAELAAK